MADRTKVAQVGELPDNTMKAVRVGDKEIALVALGGQVYAIGDVCPHAHCSLSDGEIDGDHVICPCHGSEFNIKTGELVDGPAQENIPTFHVHTEGNDILVAT